MKRAFFLPVLLLFFACHTTREINPETPPFPVTRGLNSDDSVEFLPEATSIYPVSQAKRAIAQANSYYFERLETVAQFNAASTASDGVIKGSVVKFLIDNRTSPAKIYFINGAYTKNGVRPPYVQYHYYFAQFKFNIAMNGDEFNDHTYFTNILKQKYFIAGTLQKYDIVENGKPAPFLGIQFYPQDYISDRTFLFAAQVVNAALGIKDTPRKLVSYGLQQKHGSIVEELKTLNIEPTSVDRIYAGISYVAMHPGEALGYLRFKPKGEQLNDLSPMDIPVFDELPLDLSVVSGVITTVIQDAGSHVNLKSKERNTPNMVLRDSARLGEIEKLDGQPVRLKVEGNQFSVALSTPAAVKAAFEKKNSGKKWIAIKNGTHKTFASFDEMAQSATPFQLTESATSYGGKSAKLAMLAHPEIAGLGSPIQKAMGYRLTPLGFAVPVSGYQDFVNNNLALKLKLEKLAQAEMSLNELVPPSPKQRAALVAEVQKMFYATEIPADLAAQLATQITKLREASASTYPKSVVKKVKVRSSANAEDIPNFDGAGLHSSFSAKIDEMGDPKQPCEVITSTDDDGVSTKEEVNPETVYCAVKGAFASLWNKRAIEERNFARIDQRSVVMGLAVNTNYDFRKKSEKIEEVANAVIVTRMVGVTGLYGYRISANTDENLVTNPTPGTQTEIIYASFVEKNEVPQLSFIQYAKLSPLVPVRTTPILNEAVYQRMVEIARQVEYAYCRNVPSYYPKKNCERVQSDMEKPTSLDMEFKVYSNGDVLLKQAREFSGK